MNKRELTIEKARIAGYKEDRASFTRLLIEARVSKATLDEAWNLGRQQSKEKMFG